MWAPRRGRNPQREELTPQTARGCRPHSTSRRPPLHRSEEPCPTCGARSGLRCQTSRYGGKPTAFLARRARLAASLLPDLQGAAGRAVQDADRQARRPAAHRAASPRAAGAVRRAGGVGGARAVGGRRRAGALLGGRRQPGQHRRGDARGREEARACPLGKRRGRAARGARRSDLGPLRAVPRPSAHQRAADVGRAGAPGRYRGRARRSEVRGAAVRSEAALPPSRHARGRHYGATRRARSAARAGRDTSRRRRRREPRACASAAASRSRRGCARRRATAPSAAGRPPRARG